jgi:hypothetical protein
VPIGREHEVGVDLVADHEQVVLACDRGDGFQLVAAEDAAGRVVRVAEQQRRVLNRARGSVEIDA